jgi:Leucine-rich repeat (LRR) protein
MLLIPGAVSLAQILEVRCNRLRSLPDELSGLQNLKELNLSHNYFRETPVSVLSRMTALVTMDLSIQYPWTQDDVSVLRVPSSLLPILHPGLVRLDLRQEKVFSSERRPWDVLSLAHLERAVAEVADRRPIPTLIF